MKNRGMAMVLLAAAVAVAAPQAAQAQQISFIGDKCPLNIMTSISGEEVSAPETHNVTTVNLLGIVDDTYVAVLYGKKNKPGFIAKAEAVENVIAFDVSSLTSVSGWTDLASGSSGDAALAVQQDLIELGFLNGGADGAFGGNTASAVSAFQEAQGLEATGTVDVFTWLLMEELAAGNTETIESPYPPVFTVESKFAAIYQAVPDAAGLEQYLTPDWKFTYDVFDGEGELSNGETKVGKWKAESDRPIDRMSITLHQSLYVYRDETGAVQLTPAFRVNSTGASRPNIRGIKLRVGAEVADLSVLKATASLDGTDVKERDIIPITEEAQQLLDGAAEGAETVVRLQGALRDYDIEIK